MSTHKSIDRICCVVLAVTILLTCAFMCGSKLGIQFVRRTLGYEEKLFDTSTVHTIDIAMDDWDGFLSTATSEEYTDCTVKVDGEAFANVAIRAKGNTSLTQVQNYGNNRYSFKIEFDHYDNDISYHGLDKLSLNNIIQDNTYMKDYLCYQLMAENGVAAPLCSFVYITVNGEDWGLYLAVEGVEDSFLERNYGDDFGELYKPDSMSMGGGRGNGEDFHMDDFAENFNAEDFNAESFASENFSTEDFTPGEFNPEDFDSENFDLSSFTPGEMPSMPDGQTPEDFAAGQGDTTQTPGNFGGGGGMTQGSDDVSLIYTDDDYDSYSNIFNNAKTDISDKDKDQLIEALKNINEQVNLEEYVDVEQVIRYFVVHNFVVNFDSYTGSMIHNYYLYEDGGQLSMIPWDYNLAFGGFESQSDATSLINFPIDTPVSGGTVDSRPMLAWIFSDEEYTALYHEIFQQFIDEIFNSGKFREKIEETVALISPYVEKDPTKFCTYDEFVKGAETLESFCLLRAESIQGQLSGTIPSTEEEQTGSNSLIDGSSVTVSDMGSMNGGGMGQIGGMGEMGQTEKPEKNSENSSDVPEKPAQSEETESAETNEGEETDASEAQTQEGMPEGETLTQPDGETMPRQENGEMPAMPDGNAPQGGNMMGDGGQMPQMSEGEMPTMPEDGNFTPGKMGQIPNQPEDSRETEAEPEATEPEASAEPSETPAARDSAEPAQQEGGQMPSDGQGTMEKPEQMPGNMDGTGTMPGTGTDSSRWIWLSVCAAVLLAGIAAAKLYKKK